MAGEERKAFDWERIEADYRAGIKTLRQIADEHSITHGAINKRAKRDGWTRSLKAKIQARAEALVSKRAVSSLVSKATEQEVVAANAHLQADIIMAQREDVPRARALVSKLFAKLEALTDNEDLVEQVTLALESGDMEKLADAARKVSAIPMLVKCVADLMGALKNAITLERQVFGIGDGSEGGDVKLTFSNDDEKCL